MSTNAIRGWLRVRVEHEMALVLLLLLMGGTSVATVVTSTWTNLNPTTGPSARQTTALAYDTESDRIVLFGGFTEDFMSSDETWAYDFETNTWVNMNPEVRPSIRNGHAMAYDVQSDRIILFGGHDPDAGFMDDTWAYDLNTDTWTNMNPAVHPTAGFGPGLAYDSESDRIILFAGRTEESRLYETWAYDFDANIWTNLQPTGRPPVGAVLHAMAYDVQSDRIVFFGGLREGACCTTADETWTYDFNRNTWTNVNPPTRPAARYGHVVAYDAQSDRVVLFGGELSGSPGEPLLSVETWAFNLEANQWTNMTSTGVPPARFLPAMAYDGQSDRILVFGGAGEGSDESWAFDLATPADTPGAPTWLVYTAVAAAAAVGIGVMGFILRRRARLRVPAPSSFSRPTDGTALERWTASFLAPTIRIV